MPTDLLLELEEGACCICGNHEGAPTLTGHDVEFLTCGNRFVFLACSGCGHLFLSPRPRMQDMGVIYANYLTNNRESAYYPSPLVARIKNGFDARRMRPVLSRLRRGSNVLDIGAGEGRLLRLLQRVFGNNWGMTHFPRHIHLFAKQHLATLARDAGLTIVHHGNTTSAPAWNMSIRNSLKIDALTKRRSIFEMFNYSNPVTLGAFTIIDILLLALRVPTSTQQLVALKP